MRSLSPIILLAAAACRGGEHTAETGEPSSSPTAPTVDEPASFSTASEDQPRLAFVAAFGYGGAFAHLDLLFGAFLDAAKSGNTCPQETSAEGILTWEAGEGCTAPSGRW